MWKKVLWGILGVFVVMQVVPYGRAHSNPAVITEPKWDSPQTREQFMASCGDCHSNQSKYPWYSNVAPVSWLVQRHIDEGREKFNISEWGRQGENEGEKAASEVREGAMPEPTYLPMHPEARMTEAQKEQFVAGLVKTFGDEKENEDQEEK